MCTGSGSFFKGIDCHWLKMDFQCNLTGSDIQIKEGSLSAGYPLFYVIYFIINECDQSFISYLENIVSMLLVLLGRIVHDGE